MMTFTITYTRRRLFNLAPITVTEEVIGALAAKRVLYGIRQGATPAFNILIACGRSKLFLRS